MLKESFNIDFAQIKERADIIEENEPSLNRMECLQLAIQMRHFELNEGSLYEYKEEFLESLHSIKDAINEKMQ